MSETIVQSPAIASDITELIGNTPLLELGRYTEKREIGARILGKFEAANPLGSVKDRAAWAIIKDAEASGELTPGTLVVDITSGNTGISVAAIAASRGYPTKFYLGDNTSPDKRRILEALGAELVPVPNSYFLDPEALEKLFAQVQEENPGAFIANQLANPANPAIHYTTTGPEIWAATGGRVDVLVAGVGTGGTASGAGRFLKEKNPDFKVIIAEPGDASLPNEDNAYPAEIDGVHKVLEIEEESLPKNYDVSIADDFIQVEAEIAYATARDLLQEQGLFVGPSAGAAVWAAAQYALRPGNENLTIVAVLPDTGERYLSAGVFFPVERPVIPADLQAQPGTSPVL